MADNIIKGNPYYDDYDSSKNFTQILAVPGNVEQAREFTQVGSIYKDFIGRLGDSIYSNGTIIDGCNISINNNKATISSGRIYLDGLIRLVNGAVLDIKGTGYEVIGAKIQSTIVTEAQDHSLLDPAQGYENYGQPGAHRLKEEVIFSTNDDTATTIYRIQDGNVITSNSEGDQQSKLIDMLAQRTYDENGNYKINGLELQNQGKTDNDGNILVSVSDGKSYILGYQVVKNYSTIIPLVPSRRMREILNEPKVYKSGTTKYQLNNYPAVNITQLTVDVETTSTINKGSAGGLDYLPNSPVISILEVKSGGTTYKQGTDYQLTSDGIDWSLAGAEPSVGSSYTVKYRYTYTMKKGTDYSISNESYTSYVKLTNSTVTPVPDSRMLVSYQFYLSRIDLILLDRLGNFSVVKGTPNINTQVEPPVNQDTTKLVIGTVLVTPDAENISIVNYYTTRLDQAELYTVKTRVQDLEYNQAVTDLDNEAIDSEQATNLRGIYTDGFIGLTKCDTSNDEFDCSIDVDTGELTVSQSQSIIQAEVDPSNYEFNAKIYDTLLTAPCTESELISQNKATSAMLVNPYSAYRPMCLVNLTPSVDNWIDTSRLVVNQAKTKSVTLRRWWYHRGASWAESEKRKYESLGISNSQNLGWSNTSVSSTSSNSEVVLDEAIMYMRSRQVSVVCSNFYPNEDNIKCYFNNNLITLSVKDNTYKGSQGGTVKADASGKIVCSFTVPANTPCGTVQVLFKGSISSGSASYTAKGRKQVIRDTIITTTTIVNTTDPLAQSFQLEEDTILSGIQLYFAAKDQAKSITIQVRNMENGYPGTKLYYAKNVSPNEIIVSGDSSKPTKITFDKPVYCQKDTQYCICILSDSNLYQLYIAELGKRDILSKSFVVTQPYEAGVLFSSSNNLTWTANQTQDLKYDLLQYNYSSDAVVMYKEVQSSTQFNKFVLAANTVDASNSGVVWYYRASRAGSWIIFEPYTEIDLGLLTNYIQIKVELTKSAHVSPILDISSNLVVAISDSESGTYVSRTVSMSNAFTTIRVLLDEYKPTGTSIDIYYQTNKTNGWTKLANQSSIIKVDDVYNQYEYSATVTSATTYKVKIVLNTNNPLVRPKCRRLRSILKN